MKNLYLFALVILSFDALPVGAQLFAQDHFFQQQQMNELRSQQQLNQFQREQELIKPSNG